MKKLPAVLIFLLLHGVASGADFGTFSGPIKVVWLNDSEGRKMQLLADASYTDQHKVTWEAPVGSIIDGASIPRIAWTIIGGPYEGLYRNASVFHDVACERRQRPWEMVHEAFYNAMRASGVTDLQAKIMYGAVYHYGPRWIATRVAIGDETTARGRIASVQGEYDPKSSFVVAEEDHYIEGYGATGTPTRIPTGMKKFSLTVTPRPPLSEARDFERIKETIEKNNPSLEEIRRLSE